jgi:glycosyltransferase involved in cell wall biosynthesis
MQGFDIFALTSDCEGHPLVVLEAMACGLPVVATAVGGIADTVRPGANGFIAPVRGVAEIARSLEALVDNPALRARMGNASRTLSRNFSVRRMAERTLAFYEQVISAARGANISPDFELTAEFPPCHGHTTAPHSPSRY